MYTVQGTCVLPTFQKANTLFFRVPSENFQVSDVKACVGEYLHYCAFPEHF